MADNFKVALQASIDIQKSQNEINKQIKTLKTDAIKIGIELDTKSAQKAISELSKEAKSLMEQDKLISNNKINSSLSNNPIINGELTSKLKEVKGELKSTDKIELTNLNKQFKNVTSETESLGKKGDTVFSKLGKKISDLLIDLAINTLRNMVNEVANLDKSLVDLQMATGYTHSQAKELLSTYINLGQQMGATGTEVADIASDYLRQGKTVAEANSLVKDSLILSKIGNMESADATTYLTTIMKGYKVSVSDVIDIIDKLSAVDIASATSTEGLAQAMSKTAENAEISGISMDKLLGIIAVIGDTTGEEMSSVGDSVNSMLSRMNNIKLSNLIDSETGEDLSNVETSLSNVGISLKDTGDTYRDFGDVLDETAGKWNTYSSATQQNIAASIAGKEHMGDFLVLMSEYSKANEYATASTNSSGSAMEQFANYENSLEAKTKSLTASFQKLASDSLDSGVIKGFMDFANVLVQIIDKVGIFNIALVALAGVLNVKTGFTAIGWITSFTDSIIAATGASTTLGLALSTMIPAALVIGGITAIVKVYEHFNVTLDEHKELLEKAKQAYAESTSELDNINKQLTDTKAKISELATKDNLTFTEKDELDKLKQSNEQLLIRKDVLEKLNAENQKDVIKNTVDTFKKQFGSNEATQQQVSEYVSNAKFSGNNLNLTSDENNIPAMIAAYKQITDLKEKAYGDNEEVQRYDGLLSDVSTSLYKNVDDLINYKTTLESIPYDQLTDDQKKYLTNINSYIELIYKNLDPNKWKQIEFDKFFNDKDFEDIKNKLNNLSKAGKLDASVIANGKEYQKFLQKTGLTASETAEQVNALNGITDKSSDNFKNMAASADVSTQSVYSLAESVNSATGYINDLGENVDISKLQDSISSAESKIKDYQTILSSMSDNGGLTNDSLETITQKYPKLLAYVSNESQLREELQTSIKKQKKTAEDYYNSVLEMDTDLYKTIVKNNADKINTLSDDYKIDIKNWQSVAQAKAEIDGTLLTELNKKWGEYYSHRAKLIGLEAKLQANNNNDPILKQSNDLNIFGIGNLSNPNSDFLNTQKKQLKELFSEANLKQKNYNDLKNIFGDTDFTLKLKGGINPASDTQKKSDDKKKSDKKEIEDKPENNFSQVFDWIEIRIDKLKEKAQKAIDDVGKYINFKYKNNQLKVAITAQVDEKKSLTSLMDSYNKKADSIKFPKKYEKYKDLVDNGGINVQTIKNEALAKKIEEYQKWKEAAAGVADEIEKIDDKIKELNAQKLDNITEYFGNINDYISAKISRKESEVSLKTDSGKSPTKHDYNALIKLENDNKKNNQNELDAYSTEFYQQIKDKDITKDSPEYLKGLSHINDLTKAINESQSAVYNYNAEIRELDWKGFDKGITKVNYTKNELADLSDMIKDSEILDDKGNYTEAGLTKVGLLSQQMSSNTKLSSEYGKAIKKIGVELKNHKISQELYNEELANYQSLQRQAIKDNQALEESIAEIAKQRVQYEIDAINKETTAFKELIDAKKDALQAEKDLHDYQESTNKKQQSINTLQKQIAALKLSTDRKDIAQRLKLEKDLKDQQANLDEEQYQHSVEAQSNALDDEYDSYKKSQDEKVTALEKSLNDQEALVKSALNEVYSNTTEISIGIQTLASEHGLTVSESIVSPWENAKTAIDAYKTALAGLPVFNNPNLDGAVSGAEIGIGADSAAKGTAGSSNSGASSQKTKKESASSNNPQNKESKSKLPISTVKYTDNKSSLNKDSSIVDRLKYFDLDSSTSARSKLYKYFGLSGSYSGLDEQNIKLIAAMKKAGFSKGGSGKLVNSLEDEGFALMKRDETTLSSEQTEQFKSLLGYAPMIKTAIDSITGENNYSSIQNTNNPVNVHYDNLITVQGSVDSNNIDQLKLIAQQAVEKGNKTLISLLNQKR